MFLFQDPISKTKVRKDVFAYKYSGGTILIGKSEYVFYSMTEAIRKWRSQNPARL
jgi:hypothetical protein